MSASDTVIEQIHAYCLNRYNPSIDLPQLSPEKWNCKKIEALLRRGRPINPPTNILPGKLTRNLPLPCEHLNYETSFFFYLPKSYNPQRTFPLILIGHGGNGNMSQAYAKQVAFGYVQDWLPIADKYGFIIAAPLTEKGWANIGYSILFSLLSKIQNWYHIDPDRIYLTGHSMGGHLSWRSAMAIGDRFGAVAPMSGGYDFVGMDRMPMLWNVPGYATFGRQEPYRIDEYNRSMRRWIDENRYPWRIVEKNGGHEIFYDELPIVAELFQRNSRNLYPTKVWGQGGKWQSWKEPDKMWQQHYRWNPQRPIPRGTFHWLRLFDRPDLGEGKKQRISGEVIRSENTIVLVSEEVRQVRIYLHPNLVDFNQPVTIMSNGEMIFQEKVQPDIQKMLYTVREYDDWGRIFWTWVDLEIRSDQRPRIWQGAGMAI